MHQALRLEVRVVMVDLAEQFLDAHILSLLCPRNHLRAFRFIVDLQDLVGNWQLLSVDVV